MLTSLSCIPLDGKIKYRGNRKTFDAANYYVLKFPIEYKTKDEHITLLCNFIK